MLLMEGAIKQGVKRIRLHVLAGALWAAGCRGARGLQELGPFGLAVLGR